MFAALHDGAGKRIFSPGTEDESPETKAAKVSMESEAKPGVVLI